MPSQKSPDSSQSEEVLVTQTRFSVEKQMSLIENQHLGWAVWSNAAGTETSCTPGAEHIATFIRSAAKPFQALPLVLTGASQALSSETLAISCASHTGTEVHIRLVEALLKQSDLKVSDLQCGADWPVDGLRRRALRQAGEPANAIYHNCSGKHAGMLFCCRQNGWPIENYLDAEHPLQRMIVENLQKLTGLTEIPLAVDGCGAPVFYLPLPVMARLYASLGSEPLFAPLREAMLAHPELVGGPGRVDTAIMQASGGKILAKVGADGVLCVANPNSQQGLALKIADGSAAIRNFALVEILVTLGWLSAQEAKDPRLSEHREARRLNSQRKTIGETRLHFASV
jgi:L-asparaginase